MSEDLVVRIAEKKHNPVKIRTIAMCLAIFAGTLSFNMGMYWPQHEWAVLGYAISILASVMSVAIATHGGRP